MNVVNERLYEDSRRQLLIEIRLCPPADGKRFIELTSALNTLEEAHARHVAQENERKKTVYSITAHCITVAAVALLGQSIPLTSKAWAFVKGAKLL